MSFIALFFSVIVLCLSDNGLEIEPIIFVGPLGGQGLEAKLDKAKEPHIWCFNNNKWFKIWMNIWEEIPYLSLDCMMHNMEPFFNPNTKEYSNAEGVDIRPEDFGGMGAFEYLAKGPVIHKKSGYMHNWMEYLKGYGYEVGKSLRGASYDWRFGPAEWVKNEDWGHPAVIKLVEETYKMNGNKKVHLMGHSLGGPAGVYFLSLQPQEWKDKYVASYISLGGPFDGAWVSTFLNIVGFSFYQLFKANKKWIDVMKKVGGTQWMTPQFLEMDLAFIQTNQRNYSMNEYETLMKDANSTISYQIYDHVSQAMKNKPPGVPTHCLYGVNLPTPKRFYIDDLIDPLNYTVTEFTDGDTTVHLESLAICDSFGKLQPQPVNVIRYPGIAHGPMVMNQTVWEDVLKITTSEKKIKNLGTIKLNF